APTPQATTALPSPAPATAEPAAVTRPAPAGPTASRREIAQLRRIQQLMASDPAAAHRLAEASSREFPQGALREERDGLSVLALLRLGDARAQDKAERFLSRYPESPLAERIRGRLTGEPRR
ncbi:MAG TPA: hypothetical protein VJV78_34595, partial [Polyangiales bacterium]|nr:hypothetical protein [Polyangiales bacterium]